MKTIIQVRALDVQEMEGVYALVHLLRIDLDEETYRARLARQRVEHGYTMLGAVAGGAIVGIAGIREVETLARGRHLHVDDLVVRPEWRHRGVGRLLLKTSAEHARARGFGFVFLDAIAPARPFYERLGFTPHVALLMRVGVEVLAGSAS